MCLLGVDPKEGGVELGQVLQFSRSFGQTIEPCGTSQPLTPGNPGGPLLEEGSQKELVGDSASLTSKEGSQNMHVCGSKQKLLEVRLVTTPANPSLPDRGWPGRPHTADSHLPLR